MSVTKTLENMQTALDNAYDSIESKGGTLPTDLNMVNLSSAIESISGGGGSVSEKTLNFYDCFGNLVDSYDSSEIQGLTALPTPPDLSEDEVPMTFQEWNWTLADIKAYNTSYPTAIINVGAVYVPTDGKTHIKFRIGQYDENGVKFTITTTGGTVEWGDGTTETISSTTLSHVYSSAGDHDCKLSGITDLKLYSSTSGDQKYYLKAIDVRLGSNVTSIGSRAFDSCRPLTSITIPSSITSIETYAFNSCSSLTSITIPSSVTSIGTYTFNSCSSLTSITIPSSVTSIGGQVFSSCLSLTSITIPSNVTSIGNYILSSCYSLTSITIPSSITSIESSSFISCYSLTSITIPSSVTSIGSYALYGCVSLCTVIMESTTPPTLNTGVFNTSDQKHIYVPASAVDTYKNATNWSSYSSIIEANPYVQGE